MIQRTVCRRVKNPWRQEETKERNQSRIQMSQHLYLHKSWNLGVFLLTAFKAKQLKRINISFMMNVKNYSSLKRVQHHGSIFTQHDLLATALFWTNGCAGGRVHASPPVTAGRQPSNYGCCGRKLEFPEGARTGTGRMFKLPRERPEAENKMENQSSKNC